MDDSMLSTMITITNVINMMQNIIMAATCTFA